MKNKLIIALAAVGIVSLATFANATTQVQVCPEGNGWTKDEWTDNEDSNTYTAPAGYYIDEVCVKGGTIREFFTVDGTKSTWTVDFKNNSTKAEIEECWWQGCKDISHISWHKTLIPTPTPATPTPTPATPTPTPATPTPTPETPTPTPATPTPTPETPTPTPSTPTPTPSTPTPTPVDECDGPCHQDDDDDDDKGGSSTSSSIPECSDSWIKYVNANDRNGNPCNPTPTPTPVAGCGALCHVGQVETGSNKLLIALVIAAVVTIVYAVYTNKNKEE